MSCLRHPAEPWKGLACTARHLPRPSSGIHGVQPLMRCGAHGAPARQCVHVRRLAAATAASCTARCCNHWRQQAAKCTSSSHKFRLTSSRWLRRCDLQPSAAWVPRSNNNSSISLLQGVTAFAAHSAPAVPAPAAVAGSSHQMVGAATQEAVPAGLQHLTFLQELHVEDFALVSSASVSFTPGLNVISGQSGAGKSVLLDALALLLGAPATADCVRAPAHTAVVEGVWWLGPDVCTAAATMLADMGLPNKALPGVQGGGSSSGGGNQPDSESSSIGGFLHIRREVTCGSPGGAATATSAAAAAAAAMRSRVLVNGTPSSLRVLKGLAGWLVDINGQAAATTLRDSNHQLQLLDKIAGTTALASDLSQLVSRLSHLESCLSDVDALGDEGDRAMLQKKIDVINKAGLKAGEEVMLRRRLSALKSRRGCLEAAAAVQMGIQGDSGPGSTAEGGGSVNLSEALRLIMGQLKGVLAAEEQQQRLLVQQQQQQQRRRRKSSSSSNGRALYKGSDSLDSTDPGSSNDRYSQMASSTADNNAAASADGSEATVAHYEEDGVEPDPDAAAEYESVSAGVDALSAALEELEGVAEGLLEATHQLSAYADVAGFNPSEAAELTARLDLIERLARRFRVRGSSQLLQLADKWSAQLEAYYDTLGQQAVWRDEASSLQQKVTGMALSLSAARSAAAARLAAAVEAALAQLAMNHSRFGVNMDWTQAGREDEQAGPSSRAVFAPWSAKPRQYLSQHTSSTDDGSSGSNSNAAAASSAGTAADSALDSNTSNTANSGVTSSLEQQQQGLFRLRPSGLDSVTFLLSAGPSEPLRSLATTSSGGEAARIMLALKAAPAAVANACACLAPPLQSPADSQTSNCGNNSSSVVSSVGLPILVLDELDAGVGSRLGEPVGRLLRGLVAGQTPAACQVLVVTHTPQVAAHANHHIQVVKSAGPDGRVVTSFKHLTDRHEQEAELADMLGLSSDEGMHLAADMLTAAQQYSQNDMCGAERQQQQQQDSNSSSSNSSSSNSTTSSSNGCITDGNGIDGNAAAAAADDMLPANNDGKSISAAPVTGAEASLEATAAAVGSVNHGNSSSVLHGSSMDITAGEHEWLLGLSAAAAAASAAASVVGGHVAASGSENSSK